MTFVALPSPPTQSIAFRRLAGGDAYRLYNNGIWCWSIVWDAPLYVYHYMLYVTLALCVCEYVCCWGGGN